MEASVISEVLSAVFTGTALTGGNTTGWMRFVSTQKTGARDGAAVSSTGVNDSSRFQTSSWTIQPWLSNDLFLLQVDGLGTGRLFPCETELVAFFPCSTTLNVGAACLDQILLKI